MNDPVILAAFVGGAIGGLFSLIVVMVSELIKHFVRRSEEQKRYQRSRLMVMALYRNAFKALDGTMILGYLDQPQRFEATLSFLIERIKKDDVAEAFEAQEADLILRSIPALLDRLHGCIAARDSFGKDCPSPGAEERYNEQVRESASVALALIGVVLSELGDSDYFKNNLSEVNAHRILFYMNAERDRQTEDRKRDKIFIEQLRTRRAVDKN